MLLGAGATGKRFALPNARVLIHQPAIEGTGGMASDLEIQANEILRMRGWLEETIASHTGRDVELVRKDIERDKILSAAAAKEYGLIDEVLASRKAIHRLTGSPQTHPDAARSRPATGRRAVRRARGADVATRAPRAAARWRGANACGGRPSRAPLR